MADPTENHGCLSLILRLFGRQPQPSQEESLPYRLRDDFLSPAELSFFHVLQTAAGDRASICPKVSLGDLFYAKSGDHSKNTTLNNRIDRKHVDFLLCEPGSMRPWVGIELDDASHRSKGRQERDKLVEQVFAAAGLPLHRFSAQAAYNTREVATVLEPYLGPVGKRRVADAGPAARESVTTATMAQPVRSAPSASPPSCPKCGQSMVLREVKRPGPQQGRRFWGCSDYPHCRGVRGMASPGQNQG
jgi:hypothetical protein